MSPDGQHLIFTERTPTGWDIGRLTLTGDEHQIEWLLNTPFAEVGGVVSPNGHWLAYASDRSGQVEVYVSPFPDVGISGVQVSQDGGSWPVWSPNTQELFYRTAEGMEGVTLDTEPDLRVRGRQLLFDETGFLGRTNPAERPGGQDRTYDIHPDGDRFLSVVNAATDFEIHVVLNWDQELLERVPVP